MNSNPSGHIYQAQQHMIADFICYFVQQISVLPAPNPFASFPGQLIKLANPSPIVNDKLASKVQVSQQLQQTPISVRQLTPQ